ncbi:hypothetical protein V6S67_10180 [Arthrobacter sp. Soc17.1.1.1]|uniref:hypothetical protein n=1 Tax=Arthrobacter sp. Soc17.1.1.1 TaxID=3121277 RepID=UPI002FE4BFA4
MDLAVAQVLADAPASLPPLEMVMHGLAAIAAGPLAQWKSDIQARRATISRDSALRERELLKNAVLADVIARALVGYPVEPKDAQLLAAYAVLIFDSALGEWLDSEHDIMLVRVLKRTQERLRSLTALPSQL